MIKKSKVFFALLCLSIGITMAQVSKVTGVIISAEDNEPIMGASILIKGTSLGTITDIDGRYVIHNIPAGAKLLQISYVGMITQEIPISDKGADDGLVNRLETDRRSDCRCLRHSKEKFVHRFGFSRRRESA